VSIYGAISVPARSFSRYAGVREAPGPLLSARFGKYAKVFQHLNRLAGRGLGRLKEFHYCRDSKPQGAGELVQINRMDMTEAPGAASRRLAVLADEREDFSGSSDSLIRDRRYAFQKKFIHNSQSPFTRTSSSSQVILSSMALEEQTQIEQWRGQLLPMLEQQCNEQPTDAAITIEVGMDGLELNVRQPNTHQRR